MKTRKTIYLGDAAIRPAANGGASGMVERDGEPYYRIANYHSLPPFFMSLVSGSDHWMFLSSKGGLTCGRCNPDSALFPYYTDDKIHDANSKTGPRTLMLADRDGKTALWEPFAPAPYPYALERNLYKNLPGNKLIYEEINQDLGLAFSYRWSNGERFGFVRRATLRNLRDSGCDIEIMDGVRNVLPCGVTRQAQTELSTLLDGYKQAERVPGIAAGIYTLSSILTDRAEPCEALGATVVWSRGLEDAEVFLTDDQVPEFSRGDAVEPEAQARGRRTAFFVHSTFTLAGESDRRWHIVADVNQRHAQLRKLLQEIRRGVEEETIEADIAAGTRRLVSLVDAADGCQKTSDAPAASRHFSNTLFNIMRGGTFDRGYEFPAEDFLDFAGTWNAPLRGPFAKLLDGLDGSPTRETVVAAAAKSGDPDMERLALEYLPLTFSRRHGDPSRPWNRFSIDLKNADGSDKLHFQGNWRDIFQNWEALSLSYPEYIESFVAKFVNASTADGYNPYRITRNGIDWEVLEPDNSWSNIGYWGDHQVNYLLKLLELSLGYHPGKLGDYLEREIFVYANVPYRIKRYAELLEDPRDSVSYDFDEERAIEQRVAERGSDGKLVVAPDGSICRVNLLEKLLNPVLAKISNFVPGGGIWMNTQRPEWNDANNALVGYGLSMVTLCYLRRYLHLLAGILADHAADAYPVSEELAAFFTALDGVLGQSGVAPGEDFTPGQRKDLVDGLGRAGESYRERVYAGMSGKKSPLRKAEILGFIERVLAHFDQTIAGNLRPDGLYHSYNLIRFGDSGFEVERLYEMLEGQVAVLSSGCLDPEASLALLESLRVSAIYRPDQNSYMLYPDREQVSFLEKNVIPTALLDKHAWIRAELEAGRTDLVERDVEGDLHFNGRFRNAGDLAKGLATRPDLGTEESAAIREVYEAVFSHRRFTGRSGSMFKYEGLGSIYWHMVSKLLLATAEVITRANQDTVGRDTFSRLLERFDDIKEGLGMHKTPAQYGAFPTDPYSHTPGFAGVQQPGMTGQVKEDFITRFMELGVSVCEGRISFAPDMLRGEEFLDEPAAWSYPADGGEPGEELPAGCLAFSLCAVPVIYRLADRYAIRVDTADDGTVEFEGNRLDEASSRSVFRRDGRIRRITVEIPRNVPRQT